MHPHEFAKNGNAIILQGPDILNLIYYAMAVVQVVMSLTSYIPQIIKLIKTKRSNDISLWSWILSLIDFTSYQILLLTGNSGWMLNTLNALQIIQIIFVIVLIKIYRQPEN